MKHWAGFSRNLDVVTVAAVAVAVAIALVAVVVVVAIAIADAFDQTARSRGTTITI